MRKTLSSIAFMIVSAIIFSQTFEVDGIHYNIISINPHEVEVISKTPKYEGNIVIPETVFYDNTSYTVTAIGFKAFSYCYLLHSVVIGNSVKIIGRMAFEYCTNLDSLVIGSSVHTIQESAFKNCESLLTIDIPNSVIAIEDFAFFQCRNVANLFIGNSVISIGEGGFNHCLKLTSVLIPPSVEYIGSYAFSTCGASFCPSDLAEVICCAVTPPALGIEAFNNTPVTTIQVPSGSQSLYQTAANWNDLQITETSLCNGLSVENHDDHLLSVYPNPCTDFFAIMAPNGVSPNRVLVFDVFGSNLLDVSLNTNTPISVKSLPEGVYFYRIIFDGKSQNGRIVVQR